LVPQIIEVGRERGRCVPPDNLMFEAGMLEAERRAYLADAVDTIERQRGARSKGWLGPTLI
jgi:hypothetical protein